MSSDNYSTSNWPCGACKFLRRKCVTDCVFAPYFASEEGAAHFGAVHKIFGASNVSKLLKRIPANKRLDAVMTICYEAEARVRDPVYGCVPLIFDLQQEVLNLQAALAYMQNFLSSLYQLRCQTTLLGQASFGPPSDHAVIFNTHQQQQSRVMFNSQDSLGFQSGNVGFQALASMDFPGVSGNVDFQALAQELLSMDFRWVVNLQAELAHQILFSSLDHDLPCQTTLPGLASIDSTSDHAVTFNTQQSQQSAEMFNGQDSLDLQSGNSDFQTLAQELLSNMYFPGVSSLPALDPGRPL